MSLPDDCLLETLRHLELNDLSIIASVCEHLQQVARKVFSLKWKESKVIVNSVEEAHDYLRNFGPIAQTIRLDAWKLPEADHNRILSLLVRYCGGNLTRLELKNIYFAWDIENIERPESLFVGVKNLVLNRCLIPFKWFMGSHDLVELNLKNSNMNPDDVCDQRCPSLVTLKIFDDEYVPMYNVLVELHRFLLQNNQLKAFEVDCDFFSLNAATRFFDFVPTTIERLKIHTCATRDLTRFVYLKELHIDASRYSCTKYADHEYFNGLLASETVENLEIDITDAGFSKESMNGIVQLRNVRTLRMQGERGCAQATLLHIVENLKKLRNLILGFHETTFGYSNGKDLFDIIQRGRNLQLLILIFSRTKNGVKQFELNANEYRKMLDAVLRRVNGKPLHIVIIRYQDEKTRIDVTFSTESSLKITCLAAEAVARILNIRIHKNDNYLFSVTVGRLAKLRDCGLLGSLHENEF